MFYYEILWFYQDFNSENLWFFRYVYLVHAARVLELSLEVMLSPPKRGTKHLYFTTLKAFPSCRNRYNTFSEAKYRYNIFQKPNTLMFLRRDSWL